MASQAQIDRIPGAPCLHCGIATIILNLSAPSPQAKCLICYGHPWDIDSPAGVQTSRPSILPAAPIRPSKPRQSSTITDSEFSRTPPINTPSVATKQTAKSKAKEASDLRNEAITKEAEVRKLTKSGGKFDMARNDGKKQVFETGIRTYDDFFQTAEGGVEVIGCSQQITYHLDEDIPSNFGEFFERRILNKIVGWAEYLEAEELEITRGGVEIIFLALERNIPITGNGKTKKMKVLFSKIIPNSEDDKTLGNLMGKFQKDLTVWIMVPVKKAYNYMPRAKAMESTEPKVEEEPVANAEVSKANEVDLPLDNLSVGRIDNTNAIIKKEPQLSSAIRFSKPKKVQVIDLLSSDEEVETPWHKAPWIPVPSVKPEHQSPPLPPPPPPPPLKTSTPPRPSTPLTSNKRGLEDRTVPSPETPARQPRGPTKRTRKFTKKAVDSGLDKVLEGHEDEIEKTCSEDNELLRD